MKALTNILAFGALALLAAASVWGGSIVDTRHNLSISGPGPVKSDTEGELCIFCHTPHHARTDVSLLWNRANSTAVYTTYDSSTMRATVGQPTGASALCLSCHDGTIALGAVLSRTEEISFPPEMAFLTPDRPSYIGTDLTDDHPVSFRYQEALDAGSIELVTPDNFPEKVRLDKEGMLQCTACHDPHDNDYGKFLVMDNRNATLCRSCHTPTGWANASHSSATAGWDSSNANLSDMHYTSVAENACANCHRPHKAEGKHRLLRYGAGAASCVLCHDGSVAGKNIVAEFGKPYGHFIQNYGGLHDPSENPPAAMAKHVECADCHNPHRANADTASAPAVPGSMRGVKGINRGGTPVAESEYMYEICLKCHSGNNQFVSTTHTYIPRLFPQTDKRLAFDATNASRHPVMDPQISTSAELPSLLYPYRNGGKSLYCTSCHANDDPNGPKGPHGSSNPYLLKSEDTTAAGGLCFECHDRDYLLNPDYVGKYKHSIHADVGVQCSTCHDPHGSQNFPRLLNFNLDFVSPNSLGCINYTTDASTSKCGLSCHVPGLPTKDHVIGGASGC